MAGNRKRMETNELAPLLARLHRELEAARAMHAESREMLQQVARDIDRLLQEPAPAAFVQHAEQRRRLEDWISRFQVEHPRVSVVVREMVDALGKAGI
ncbi:MAG: DUF4404 family protein [Steroidobacteraceae bacterium]